MNNSKFNEGYESSYAELPVPVNYLYWKRGNASLSGLRETDPGAFFGGWSASLHGREDDMPALPLPIVTRFSDDGQATYERYASNVIKFLPITSRMRYELREKRADKLTGREVERVAAVSKNYTSGVTVGFQPHKQVFGIVYSDDMQSTGYAVLKLNKWSSFLAFSKAAQAWSRVKVEDGHVLVRRYGSVGVEVQTKNGITVMPKFDVYGEGKSTPIEAIAVNQPIFVKITSELDGLWDAAQGWSACQKWNAAGQVVDETQVVSPALNGEFPDDLPVDEYHDDPFSGG